MREKVSMITGNPTKSLVLFTLPIIFGNLFQQLYSIVDTVVVGNFVGSNALAAVGTSTTITFLFVAIATGSSIGCSVVISQLYGAKKLEEMKTAVYTALIAIFVIAALLSVLGLAVHRSILKLLNTPQDIFEEAAIYLKVYMAGLVFLFMYNILTAIFNAMGESKIPLYFLMFSSLLNIALDILFVIRFKSGVEGVAIATMIAQSVSAMLSASILIVRLRRIKTEGSYQIFSFQALRQMGKVAVPSTIQQSIVSFGIVFVQALVNRYGSVVIAGYTTATKIDNIAIMPMVNIGNAVSTFTAQNIGANQTERVKEGYRAGIFMTLFLCIIIVLTLLLFGRPIVSMFMDTESSAASIDVALEYLRVVSIFYFFMGFMNVTNGVLRGSGDMNFFMISTLANFFSRVILAYGLAYFLGEQAIWWSIPMGWTIGLVIARARYHTGNWKKKVLI